MGMAFTAPNTSAQSSRAFRDALGTFSTGVTVITCRSPLQGVCGVTINSFSSLSLDPPLVMWSLSVGASSHASFVEAEHFVVHVLSAEQEDIAYRFARSAGARFEGLELETGPGGAPLIPDTAARFECHTVQRYWGGDHVIFLGQVEAFSHDPARSPLIFHRGRMRQLLPTQS